jgi:hypothetical protein
MAVVQISRIQVRRGKANSGTGIPQLASGELAWAIDNQQLYIGNGSVAEGSPAVGNTKILTENDLTAQGNILNLIQHIYRADDPSMQTGATTNTPVTRYLQDRLDDRVTTRDFGAIGDGITDDTAAIQRAIDQLFLNPTTVDSTESRVVLELPTGTYIVTDTIYIPPYATIVGEGVGCSVIEFTGTGPVFQFINGTSTIGSPSDISSTLEINQPRNIAIKDLTVHTFTNNQTALKLDAVADSTFENLEIIGEWNETVNNASIGIALYATPSVGGLVTSTRNKFKNITIHGFTHAVSSKQDISHNDFRYCYINDVYRGFDFGRGSNGSTNGEQTGPIESIIESCYFYNVKRQAVYIERGIGNTVVNCRMEDVGNDGGGHLQAKYPQVYFKEEGNEVKSLKSDRPEGLANQALLVPYVPEVAGHANYNSYGTRTVSLVVISGSELAFRLPLSTDEDGVPTESISYAIDYVFRSPGSNTTRQGTITIIADVATKLAQLSDDYNFVGAGGETDLSFSVKLLDEVGSNVTGALESIPYSIALKFTNSLDSGSLTYSYNSIS